MYLASIQPPLTPVGPFLKHFAEVLSRVCSILPTNGSGNRKAFFTRMEPAGAERRWRNGSEKCFKHALSLPCATESQLKDALRLLYSQSLNSSHRAPGHASVQSLSSHPALSAREQSVLVLLARGHTNKQIAAHLSLSPTTIDTHLRHLFAKLECKTRTQAVSQATQLGWLSGNIPYLRDVQELHLELILGLQSSLKFTYTFTELGPVVKLFLNVCIVSAYKHRLMEETCENCTDEFFPFDPLGDRGGPDGPALGLWKSRGAYRRCAERSAGFAKRSAGFAEPPGPVVAGRPPLFLLTLTLLPCALATPGALTVGSKLDGEGVLLCQIVKLILEHAKFTLTDRCATGNTATTRNALLDARIDLYPEYSGNVMFLFPDAKLSPTIGRNATRSWYQGQRLDAPNAIVWLRPAPANNTFALALPKTLAEHEKLRTMSDLARYLNAGGKFKLAATFEFLTRDDRLKAFEQTYGFKLEKSQTLITSGGSSSETQEAAALGVGGVNAALTNRTDGALEKYELIPLIDDKAAVAVYAPLITVRREVLSRSPEIKTLIAAVWDKLNTPTLIRLNAQVAQKGIGSAEQVARDYLLGVGALK